MRISRKIAGLSMLGAMVLQMVIPFVSVAAAIAAAPVKLVAAAAPPVKLVETGPVKLVLAIVTLILAIWAPTASAAERPVKEIVTNPTPSLTAGGPTKWIKDFQVGRNVDRKKVEDRAQRSKERGGR